MQRFGERFDHNLHALRIVESFEQRYARFPGLNLTFEVREGIVKHSHDFGPGEDPELEAYLPGLRPAARGAVDRPGGRNRLQHGRPGRRLFGRILTAGDVADAVPQYREIHEAMETQFPGATDRERFHESLRQLIDVLVSGLIEGTVAAARAAGVADSDGGPAVRTAAGGDDRRRQPRPASPSSDSCTSGSTPRPCWGRTGGAPCR